MAKANKALAEQRTDEVLGITLDGAMHRDVVAFVREKEKETGSAWFVGEGETPLSDAMIRKYQERSYRLIEHSHETSRRRLFRRHVAKLNNLYGRAVTTGELSVARAILRDEAELRGLYPPTRLEHSGKGGGPLMVCIEDLQAARKKAEEFDRGAEPSRNGD